MVKFFRTDCFIFSIFLKYFFREIMQGNASSFVIKCTGKGTLEELHLLARCQVRKQLGDAWWNPFDVGQLQIQKDTFSDIAGDFKGLLPQGRQSKKFNESGTQRGRKPVMDKNMLMGVISFHDVARAVVDSQGFENKMLKAFIHDWPEGVDTAALPKLS